MNYNIVIFISILFSLIFLLIVGYSLNIYIKNKNELKLFFKSALKQIKVNFFSYFLLSIFIFITLSFSFGSFHGLSDFISNTQYSQKQDLYYHNSIDMGETDETELIYFDKTTGEPKYGVDWSNESSSSVDENLKGISSIKKYNEYDNNIDISKIYPNPNPLEYQYYDLFQEIYSGVFFTDDYLSLNYGNKNNNLGGKFIYQLDSRLNLYIAEDSTDLSVDNATKTQVIRTSTLNDHNTYEINGSKKVINTPYELQPSDSKQIGDSIINKGSIYVNESFATKNNLEVGDQLDIYYSVQTSATSEAVLQKANSETLTVKGFVNPYEFIYPSIENTIKSQVSRSDQPDEFYPVIYINNEDYFNIYYNLWEEKYINQKKPNSANLIVNYDINTSFKIAYNSILDSIYSSKIYAYDNFKSDIYSKTGLITEDYTKYFKKNAIITFAENSGSSDIYYSSGVIDGTTNISVFDIYDSNYGPSNNNLLIYDTYQSYQISVYFILFLLIIIVIVIIILVISKNTKANLKTIGALKSIGINRKIIELSSSLSTTVPIIFSTILSIFVGPAISIVWFNILDKTFYWQNNVNSPYLFIIVIAFISFISLSWMLSYLITKIIIRKPAIELVKNTKANKPNKAVKAFGKININNFGLEYGIKNILRSFGKSFFIFIIIGSITLLLTISFSSRNIIDTSIDKTFESITFDPLSLFINNKGNINFQTNDEFTNNPNLNIVDFLNEDDNKDNIIQENEKTKLSEIYDDQSNPKKEEFLFWYKDLESNFKNIEIDANSYIPSSQINFFVEQANQFTDIILPSQSSINATPLNDAKIIYRQFTQDNKDILDNNTSTLQVETEFDNIMYMFLDLSYTTSLYSSTSNKSNDINNQPDWNYKNNIGASFNTQTYNQDTQIPANLRLADQIYNDKGNPYSVSTNAGIMISDPYYLQNFINIQDDSLGGNAISYLIDNPNYLGDKIFTNPKNGNLVSCNPDSIYYDANAKCVNAVIDSSTANSYLIKKGDILTVDLNDNSMPTVDIIYVNIVSVGYVPFPLGIIVSENSTVFKDDFIASNKNPDNYYNFLAGSQSSYDYSNTVSLTTSLNLNSSLNFEEIVDSVRIEFGDTNAIPNISLQISQVVYPLIEENFDQLTQTLNILTIIVLFVGTILMFLTISSTITDIKSESLVLKAQGYSVIKISNITLTGYSGIMLITYLIVLPLSILFINFMSNYLVVQNFGVVALSLSIPQILSIFAIVFSIIIIMYIFSSIYFSHLNPSKALKKG